MTEALDVIQTLLRVLLEELVDDTADAIVVGLFHFDLRRLRLLHLELLHDRLLVLAVGNG